VATPSAEIASPAAPSGPGPVEPPPTAQQRIVPAPVVDPDGSIRVGIALERERIRVGAFGETWLLRGSGGAIELRAPIEAVPVAGRDGEASWYLQIASMSERPAAEAVAAATGTELGLPTRVADAGISGRHPVLVGPYPTREAALELRSRVPTLSSAFPVAQVDSSAEVGISLQDVRGERWLVAGREVDLAPGDGTPANFGGDPYRGVFRFRIGTRGRLHLVDLLPLEEYLKGVVPAEMGPKQFGELEALKAQAVAARSYAIRRRGESANEGYDLCATPRCQVYKGISAEDPLTSRAVTETAGLVVSFEGKVADTLFTSTCGGATEDVSNVFPDRSEPYLAGVSCRIEEKSLPPIEGSAGPGDDEASARGGAFGRWLEARGVRLPRELDADFVLAASNVIRKESGAPPLPGRPTGTSRSILLPALLETFRLSEASEILDRRPDRARLAPLAGGDERLARSVELLRRFDWDVVPVDGAPAESLSLDGWLALAAFAAEQTGLLERVDGRLLPEPLAGWMLRPATGPEWVPVRTSRPWLLWLRSGSRWSGAPRLTPSPIDRATAWVDGAELLGLAVELADAGDPADRDSSWSRWTRRFRKSQLLGKIRERKPIADLAGFEVVGRSATGRITSLEVRTGGEPLLLRGLDIRFALDLPESLAAIVPAAPIDGEPTWLFLGRGWGHGVGLCQWGAYGMALAGHDFREILAHYYTGTTVRPLSDAERLPFSPNPPLQ
jgi:stage II sporulation protein D